MPRRPDPRTFLPLGDLALHVLVALGEGPLHGYAIIQDIEARSGGRTTVRSGTLYVTLHKLHEEGLVGSAEAPPGVDARRRYHRLTPLGREVVRLEVERLRSVIRAAAVRHLAPAVDPRAAEERA